MNRKPKLLTGKEEESFKQKLQLVVSMSGSDLETSLSVLLYAAAHVAVANDVEFASVIRSFAGIYMSHPNHQNGDDEYDDEGDE